MMAMPDLLRVDGEQSAQPPFSHAQINETVTHRQILNIYQHARPETKVYYDKGRDTDGLEEENWVIRWLLWHVFRYRDNRNKSRRQASPLQRSPSGSEHSNGEHQSTNNGELLSPCSLCQILAKVEAELNNEGNSVPTASKNSFYDPVRDN